MASSFLFNSSLLLLFFYGGWFFFGYFVLHCLLIYLDIKYKYCVLEHLGQYLPYSVGSLSVRVSLLYLGK